MNSKEFVEAWEKVKSDVKLVVGEGFEVACTRYIMPESLTTTSDLHEVILMGDADRCCSVQIDIRIIKDVQ